MKPEPLQVTAFDVAQRFIDVRELPGEKDNPFILAMLTLDNTWPQHDEVPWCSAFVNYVAWLLRLPRSKSLAARSWTHVGAAITLADAVPGFDIVVLSRGTNPAHGHVGFFSGIGTEGGIDLLGGNQGNTVSVRPFSLDRLVAVRRIHRT